MPWKRKWQLKTRNTAHTHTHTKGADWVEQNFSPFSTSSSADVLCTSLRGEKREEAFNDSRTMK